MTHVEAGTEKWPWQHVLDLITAFETLVRRQRTFSRTALLISVDESDKLGVRKILHTNLALVVNEFQNSESEFEFHVERNCSLVGSEFNSSWGDFNDRIDGELKILASDFMSWARRIYNGDSANLELRPANLKASGCGFFVENTVLYAKKSMGRGGIFSR